MNSGAFTFGVQSFSNQVPPKVFTTVVSGAMISPQPGSPRRQIPFIPGCAPSTFAARSATSCQVGRSGMVRPFAAKTSLRYMRNEDSP
ncbi:MAG: hypothetical protein AUI10_01365 [Actinobacteria bacterium 13_2_20CM_2_72_6]|nr:MAG: hypothetical protein AUI10_01365 [Actinobacteria bacterium 13_2_20CM_2_72_6]